MAPRVHILIPAAGASRRMGGGDKLTEDVGGKPLLRHMVETALATGAPVFVTLPRGAAARRTALAGLALRLLDIPDATAGLSRSLVRGAMAISAAAPGPHDGLMILPADMPDLTTEALTRVIAAFQAAPGLIHRGGSESGAAGHPVIFPQALWPELQSVTGDEGGRSILQRRAGLIRIVPLPGTMALLDLDTPQDWKDWRARRS